MFKHRGKLLEELINKAIIIYQKENNALIHKFPLPIALSQIKKQNGKLIVTKGFITKHSNVDYYGLYKAKFLAFEAKSTNLDYLPWANIKLHQQYYLEQVKALGGISFYIIAFKNYDQYFLLTLDSLKTISGQKLTLTLIRKKGYPIEIKYPGYLHFLNVVKKLIIQPLV